jgi:polyisoprenoid-binding protein YceI
MRINGFTRVALVAGSIAALPLAARAEDALRITSGDITVVCPMTIGGSFEAKTTALSGSVTPGNGGTVKGALTVDLVNLDTGISLRNRHLRNNYLEVQKGPDFSTAKLENIRVEKLPGKTTFKGTMTLHGQQHEVSGTADVQQDGKGYRVQATFPLQISAFQIPEPTYLGVGVKDEITVQVNLVAAPAAAATTTSAAAPGSSR